MSMLRSLFSCLPKFWANWMTLLGTAVATVAGCAALFGVVSAAVQDWPRPYSAAITFLVMPMVLVFGLLIMLAGFIWEKNRKKDGNPDPIRAAFQAAMQDKRARRLILFVGLATLVNIVIIAAAGTAGLSYMDTPVFCGEMCHKVMQPEYDTYKASPHARVACVRCHIGPGASWAVKAKVDGLRQVVAMFTGSYSTPIPSPVHTLRPARYICEECHWPANFHGNDIKFFTKYGDDEANSPEVTALSMRIGGQDPVTGEFRGIHWHVSQDIEVRYEPLDEKRERIGMVQVYEKGELKAEYLPENSDAEDAPADRPNTDGVEFRTMDCVDCHNRPTHVFDQTPRMAVDRAFLEGSLDASVPFLHKAAVQVLAGADNIDRDSAGQYFVEKLKAAFASGEGEQQERATEEQIGRAASAVTDLYLRNVYPHMKLTWGTHPNHLGHRGEEKDMRGCFRCHNEKHTARDGKTISMDCELCHSFVAEEDSPDELYDVVKDLYRPDYSK